MKHKLITVLFSLLFLGCNTQNTSDSSFDPELRLKELGIVLPETSSPVANYVNTVASGNLLYVSGKGPLKSDGTYIEGKVGKDLTPEEVYQAARLTGINLIATIKSAIGDLRKVKRIIRVTGMVNAVPEFSEHPKVINGCSDLLVQVFGERGRHTRAAVGMGSLPSNIAVEIDLILELED